MYDNFVFICCFRDEITNKTVNQKVTLSDALLTCDQCISNMGFWTWLIIMISFVVWIYHAVKFLSHVFQYWDVKAFFNTALKISDVSILMFFFHLYCYGIFIYIRGFISLFIIQE